MRPPRCLALLLLAACHHAHPAAPLGNGAAAGGAALDPMGFAFGPSRTGSIAELEATRITPSAADAAIALQAVPEDLRGNTDGADPLYYDVDGDGRWDVFLFPQVFYGPSSGFAIYVRDGGGVHAAFAGPGAFDSFASDAGGVQLRYTIDILAGGEADFSRVITLGADKRWTTDVKSYAALQGQAPKTLGATRHIEVTAATQLRASPAVDDRPGPTADEMMDAYDKTMVLRGNVLAEYAAGAHGVAIADEGDWVYVAIDPSTRPTRTSLQHGMDETDTELPVYDSPDYAAAQQHLRAATWLVGWMPRAAVKLE